MENTISLISAVMQTIIAAIGIFITVIEIKRDRKEKKRVEKLKKIEEDIVNGIAESKVDEAKANLAKTLKELEKNLKDIESHKTYCESIEILIKEYADEKVAVERIYKQLLADETEFSLSYGFERYINAFREFISVSDDQLETIRSRAQHFCDFDDKFFAEGTNEQIRNYILERVGRLFEIQNDNPLFSRDDVIEYYKNRMRDQNKTYDAYLENNLHEKAIYAYFTDYYDNVFYPVKIVIERIEKIDPFIKELKYKYLRDEQK